MSQSLRDILAQIRGEKIKDRQEGLAAIRSAFSSDAAIEKFDSEGDGLRWLVVYQALFTAVAIEKKACFSKKGTTAAERRLSDTAATMRWLIERSVLSLSRKSVRALLSHLSQTLSHEGRLLTVVALDYLKAIRCIIIHAPHLEHMDNEMWIVILRTAFNIILGDSLGTELDEPSAAAEHKDMDDGEENPDSDEEMLGSDTSGPRKRRRIQESSSSRSFASSHHSIKHRTTSLEQIESASLVSILLDSPSTPLLSSTYTYLPAGVLGRLSAILRVYPSDSSIYHDILSAVTASLQHLSLNHKDAVTRFAVESWEDLLSLWSIRIIGLKERLIAILKTIFPYCSAVRHQESTHSSVAMNNIGKLYQLLESLPDARKGIEGIDLDRLRLQIVEEASQSDPTNRVFCAHTFRAGQDFDRSQALAWAILELYADCIAEILTTSESVISTLDASRSHSKRARPDRPLHILLDSIGSTAPLGVRCYRLQVLLFFIDRHWLSLHDGVRQEILSTLMQCISSEEASIQTHVLMCLASVARGSSSSSSPASSVHTANWDNIWAYVMRRTHMPLVSRAACHVAHVLLTHSQVLLSPQRILQEIETSGKDLDVQGPAALQDSSCAFLSLCLEIARRDVRLYRLHLEEKALGWLSDAWQASMNQRVGRSFVTTVNAQDILLLIESIIGTTQRSNARTRTPLPESMLTDTLLDHLSTTIIRNFLLQAKLPELQEQNLPPSSQKASSHAAIDPLFMGDNQDFPPPGVLERKLSSLISRFLNNISLRLDDVASLGPSQSAQVAHQATELAVIAIVYEVLLAANCTRPTHRSVKAACKLLTRVIPLLESTSWTTEEKLLILVAMEPILPVQVDEEFPWTPLVVPNDKSGIHRETLRKILSRVDVPGVSSKTSQEAFYCVARQVLHDYDDFSEVFDELRLILVAMVRNGNQAVNSRADNDNDGFAPIVATQGSATHHLNPTTQMPASGSMRRFLETIVVLLASAPSFSSMDKRLKDEAELTDILLNVNEESFLLLGPAYFRCVRRKMITIQPSQMEALLSKLEPMLAEYSYARNESLLLLVVDFLMSTFQLWTSPHIAVTEVGRQVRVLCHWFGSALAGGKVRPWRVRDRFIIFLDRYLSHDPLQAVWYMTSDEDAEEGSSADLAYELQPSVLLMSFGADPDIRVRIRAATVNPHLISVGQVAGADPMATYREIQGYLSKDTNEYEAMLTRLLCLGNVLILSSSIRRGAYWYLLELAFHTPLYLAHLTSVLSGVSTRMGLSLSDLFEAYASQIAETIRLANHNILRFPPQLLGYSSHSEFAKVAFKYFAPTYLVDVISENGSIQQSRASFKAHCESLGKSMGAGVIECFPDVVASIILSWIDGRLENSNVEEELEAKLRRELELLAPSIDFDSQIHASVTDIIFFILRALGDVAGEPDGDIATIFNEIDYSNKSARVLRALSKFRLQEKIEPREPRLPSYSRKTILIALRWLFEYKSESKSRAAVYHVLHRLFAEIHRSPLVDEQSRLINALNLWTVIHLEEFADQTLLGVLLGGVAKLLDQEDLVPSAQSILDFWFGKYASFGQADPRFPSTFIRVCATSHKYSISPLSERTALGVALENWVEAHALVLCRSPELKGQMMKKVLPAWPYEPGGELSLLCHSVLSADISSALGQATISSNKFSMVHRLHLLPRNEFDKKRFGQSDFWRLKDCIPSEDILTRLDTNAYTALLEASKGKFETFATELPMTLSIRTGQQRAARKENDTANIVSLTHHSIITFLMASLETNSAPYPYETFCALRDLTLLMPVGVSEPPTLTSEQRQELQYLQAFRHQPLRRPFRKLSDLENLNLSPLHFVPWVTQTVMFIADVLVADIPSFGPLASLLVIDISLAEEILPVLVLVLLHIYSTKGKSTAITAKDVLSSHFNATIRANEVDKRCLRSIIDTILHLRNFKNPRSHDALAYNTWLDIDFAVLSRVSVTCGAYTTALLFLELAVETEGHPLGPPSAPDEHILFEIYSHIDEPDGFYGIQTSDLGKFLVKRFHHEKQWDKAFRFHGAALEVASGDPSEAEGMLSSLHHFGFDRMAMLAVQDRAGSGTSDNSSLALTYDLGWRTQIWDLPSVQQQVQPGSSVYCALRAIARERDEKTIDSVVQKSLFAEMNHLRQLENENIIEIREAVKNLMCLRQISEWRHSERGEPMSEDQPTVWKKFNNISSEFDFVNLEAIMSTRMILLRLAAAKEQRDQIGAMTSPLAQQLSLVEERCLLRLSSAARKAQNYQIALNAVTRAKKLNTMSHVNASVEFSNVLWGLEEQKTAIQSLKGIVLAGSENLEDGSEEKASLLARLGTWTSEACLEKPRYISTQYFQPAVALLVDGDGQIISSPTSSSVFYQYAIFAERQYQVFLKSPDTIRFRIYMDRKNRELSEQRELLAKASHGSQAYHELSINQGKTEKLLKEDRKKFFEHNQTMSHFREQALEMFSRCLEAGDEHSSYAVMRFCSLWLANFDEEELQVKIQPMVARIASHKMVFLSHQLSARILKEDEKPSIGQLTLRSLILRMCREHPFHSLHQLYCLRQTQGLPTGGRRQSSRIEYASSQADREAAAADIFAILREDKEVQERVLDFERLCDASLEWAKYPVKKSIATSKRKGPYRIPDNIQIRNLKDIKVPVMTAHTPLDMSMRYDDCVWVARYESTFSTAGGVNLPKISICWGSDGKPYKQLFKGEGGDDMRQDAVMEQVFEQVNTVLRRDIATRSRHLSVRDYKVIPLPLQAGLLEFVEGTIPLQGWLSFAHARYYPDDIKPNSFSEKLRRKWDDRVSLEAMQAIFIELRKSFRPVMRHYFTEQHTNPISWFAMRLRYTRSVATSSVVGHIVGLGDRHPSNILLHALTGEVVHIDLGIAFEQGKLLPIPERVPFRLTADMVDGMGVAGTQGVFQRCAEETLRVLRDGSDTILTVLEVLRYDPLHSWTASDMKIKRVQDTKPARESTIRDLIGIDLSSDSAAEAADRALSAVQRKLEKTLSVEYTINELVAEATDTMNLANMFAGWGPHL